MGPQGRPAGFDRKPEKGRRQLFVLFVCVLLSLVWDRHRLLLCSSFRTNEYSVFVFLLHQRFRPSALTHAY